MTTEGKRIPGQVQSIASAGWIAFRLADGAERRLWTHTPFRATKYASIGGGAVQFDSDSLVLWVGYLGSWWAFSLSDEGASSVRIWIGEIASTGKPEEYGNVGPSWTAK
jgi:hypothetical protein